MKRGGAGKRRDATEAEIIRALRAIGAFVVQCHGAGTPDLVVLYRSRWFVMEIKSEKGRLRPSQMYGHYPIVRTPEQALAVLRPNI